MASSIWAHTDMNRCSPLYSVSPLLGNVEIKVHQVLFICIAPYSILAWKFFFCKKKTKYLRYQSYHTVFCSQTNWKEERFQIQDSSGRLFTYLVIISYHPWILQPALAWITLVTSFITRKFPHCFDPRAPYGPDFMYFRFTLCVTNETTCHWQM